MHKSFHLQLDKIEKRLEKMEGRYRRYLNNEQRHRKKERDMHLTSKDETILIESFVIGGLTEKLLEAGLARFFKF